MYKNIIISREEYFNLKKDSLKLKLLEEGGVSDWEWYSESINPEGKDFDEVMEKLRKEMFNDD